MSLSSLAWECLPPFLFNPRLAKTRNQSQLVLGILRLVSMPPLGLCIQTPNALFFINRVPEPVLDVRALLCGEAVPERGRNREREA